MTRACIFGGNYCERSQPCLNSKHLFGARNERQEIVVIKLCFLSHNGCLSSEVVAVGMVYTYILLHAFPCNTGEYCTSAGMYFHESEGRVQILPA